MKLHLLTSEEFEGGLNTQDPNPEDVSMDKILEDWFDGKDIYEQ